MKLILNSLRRHWALFAASLLFLAAETAADLFQPAFMAAIVDKGVAGADVRRILVCGATMLCVALLGAIAAVLRCLLSSRLSQRIGAELRRELFTASLSLSLEAAERFGTASLVTRITSDVSQVQGVVAGSLRVLVKAPLACIGAGVMMALTAPERLPVLGCAAASAAGLCALNVTLSCRRFARVQDRLDELNGVSREFLSSVRTVRAFGAEEREAARFAGAARGLSDASASAMRLTAFFMPALNLTANFGVILLLRRAHGGVPGGAGSLMASISYMTQILFSLTMFAQFFDRAARAGVSASRLAAVLDAPCEPVPACPVQLPDRLAASFEGVSFAYSGADAPALDDISFSVRAGETLGVIGPTGAGKSTLARLLSCLYRASSGVVRLGGADVTCLDPEGVRGAVALVPQKALLFTGTILDNLRWGSENASLEEVREAARTAGALDFIEALPDGMAARIGQGGAGLSGGQKQRLALARALLRRPRLLILDDCTGALDGATEARVLANLRERLEGVTVILISQRVFIVRRADRILCLESGRARGLGTHGELLASCGEYRAICGSQIGGLDE